MKPRQLKAMILLVCGVLFAAHTAQAFYNPSTGRWLSRDPIEEKGGLNLYIPVGDNLVSSFDLLGMCDQPDPCGTNVTRAMYRMFRSVSKKFWDLDSSGKQSACNQLVDIIHGGAYGAWDVKQLRRLGDEDYSGCGRTVRFREKCYYGGAANYALFGYAMGLCKARYPLDPRHDLGFALTMVTVYKVGRRGGLLTNEEALQALPFTAFGYFKAYLNWELPPFLGTSCTMDGNERRLNSLKWRWVPFQDHYEE